MSDLVTAIHLASWIDDAKEKARDLDCKIWVVRSGGGYELLTTRPMLSFVAEVWPGGRVVMQP